MSFPRADAALVAATLKALDAGHTVEEAAAIGAPVALSTAYRWRTEAAAGNVRTLEELAAHGWAPEGAARRALRTSPSAGSGKVAPAGGRARAATGGLDPADLVIDPLVREILAARNGAALAELEEGLGVFQGAALEAWTARLAQKGLPPPSAKAARALQLARVALHVGQEPGAALGILLRAVIAIAGQATASERAAAGDDVLAALRAVAPELVANLADAAA